MLIFILRFQGDGPGRRVRLPWMLSVGSDLFSRKSFLCLVKVLLSRIPRVLFLGFCPCIACKCKHFWGWGQIIRNFFVGLSSVLWSFPAGLRNRCFLHECEFLEECRLSFVGVSSSRLIAGGMQFGIVGILLQLAFHGLWCTRRCLSDFLFAAKRWVKGR